MIFRRELRSTNVASLVGAKSAMIETWPDRVPTHREPWRSVDRAKTTKEGPWH